LYSNRRMVLMNRIIPFLAALVGLVALAGAVMVQVNVTGQNEAIRAEIAEARQEMRLVVQRAENLSTRLDALGEGGSDGTAEALLALQDRLVKLETGAVAAVAPAPVAATSAAPIDPNLPVSDCIPQGTRFMVTVGDSFPICQTTIVVNASAISGDMTALDSGVTLVMGTPAPLPGGGCTASLLSTDAAGFAELRVDCRS
jgi:hypothetical protein